MPKKMTWEDVAAKLVPALECDLCPVDCPDDDDVDCAERLLAWGKGQVGDEAP